MSFPVVQRAVQRDMASVGFRVGIVQLGNIIGNAAGSLVCGLVLLHLLGTDAIGLQLRLPPRLLLTHGFDAPGFLPARLLSNRKRLAYTRQLGLAIADLAVQGTGLLTQLFQLSGACNDALTGASARITHPARAQPDAGAGHHRFALAELGQQLSRRRQVIGHMHAAQPLKDRRRCLQLR